MNAAIDTDLFCRELGGWALRGIGCAALSVFWAVMTGFQHPAEIAGMVFGLAFWVTAFAALCAWRPGPATLGESRWVRALKLAVVIKIGFILLGALGWLTARSIGGEFLMLAAMLDPALGAAALWLTGLIGGFDGIDHLCRLDSFGWTALVTIIDGALMALVIGAIAAAILGWRKLRASGLLQRLLSPARVAG